MCGEALISKLLKVLSGSGCQPPNASLQGKRFFLILFLFVCFEKRKFRHLKAIVRIEAKLASDGGASSKTKEKGLSG